MMPIDVRAAPLQRRRRRRAVVLLLVLVFMVLAGVLLVLVGAGTAQFTKTGRQEGTEAVLRQLVDSGRAWAGANADALVAGTPVTLDASPLVPEGASAQVVVRKVPASEAAQGRLVVEATLAYAQRTRTRLAEFLAE